MNVVRFYSMCYDSEGGRSQDQLTSNGYTDGSGPPTPPPTYSYIERQTSYVSDISQRSSQSKHSHSSFLMFDRHVIVYNVSHILFK